jgi:hypothetical protein
MIAVSTVYFVKPPLMKRYVQFWMKDIRLYLGGVLSALIGIIFLFSASGCAVPWFVILMGIISLAKGVVAFLLGPKKLFAWKDNLLKKPQATLRLMALIPFILGIFLIYAA